MKKIDTTRPGVIENEDDVVRSLRERGFYSSGVPRPGQPGVISRDVPTTGDIFEQYAEAVRFGRKYKFLKILSSDQFDALCASLRKR